MKYIVNFSGGLCSFWAAHRTIERHGFENTVLLFADVLIEGSDLYEFNKLAAGILGIPIVRVSRELTPWQLFRREGLIGNNRFPICSTKLKREVLNEWMESNFEMTKGQGNVFLEEATCIVGFDYLEEHRVIEMQREHPSWIVEAPMTQEPYWGKCRMETEARALGLPIAEAYTQGFTHNNCGKRCVRAGISHWVHLYRVDRDGYMEWANEENEAIQYLKDERDIEGLTILKDRRGGVTKPLPLLVLAQRIEAGEKFSKMEWGACGCGGATGKQT